MTRDLPLIAQATRYLEFQQKYPFSLVLQSAMDRATDVHAFAAPYLAMWAWKGKFPSVSSPNRFKSEGIALAKHIAQRLGKREYQQDRFVVIIKGINEIQGRVTTSAYGCSDGGSTLAWTQPSAKARREAAALSDGVYKGERFIRPKREYQEMRTVKGARIIGGS
jgi:hypothetical protein